MDKLGACCGPTEVLDEPSFEVVLDRLDVVVGDSLYPFDRRRLRLSEPLDPQLEGLMVVVGEWFKPVSYTHLDVYKRQVERRRAHSFY